MSPNESKERGNQPASPLTQMSEAVTYAATQHMGETIRERFAGRALIGLLAANPDLDPAGAALHAVSHADALIAELGKGGA